MTHVGCYKDGAIGRHAAAAAVRLRSTEAGVHSKHERRSPEEQSRPRARAWGVCRRRGTRAHHSHPVRAARAPTRSYTPQALQRRARRVCSPA